MKNIVIVGGGAGGLELATYLGNKLGRKKACKCHVDRSESNAFVEAIITRIGNRSIR